MKSILARFKFAVPTMLVGALMLVSPSVIFAQHRGGGGGGGGSHFSGGGGGTSQLIRRWFIRDVRGPAGTGGGDSPGGNRKKLVGQ